MKHRKILTLTLALSVAVFYLAGCSKENEETLSKGASLTCDTTNVSYSLDVVPILQINCYSCHAGANPFAGINLDSYTALKIQADKGDLSNAVRHTGNVTPMPYGLPQLDACNVNTIVAWVNQGTKNN
jgi:hypothetical protein